MLDRTQMKMYMWMELVVMVMGKEEVPMKVSLNRNWDYILS